MKLFAIRDFANVPSLSIKLNGKIEPHVARGTRFSIGDTEIFDDLKSSEKVTVAELMSSKATLADNDLNKQVIDKLEKEFKAEDAADKVRFDRIIAASRPAAPTVPPAK